MNTTLSRSLSRIDVALLASIIILALVARALPGPRTIDDAFITFRYSRNIVEGQGFVYNPGSQVLGTTTPLYTVLMAAISAILRGQDFQLYAIAVNALADAGTAALLFLLALRLTGNRWIAALLGALWAIAPQSVTFAVGGMETSLNIFWMIGAVWLYVTDRPVWMGVFAGLGFLTRIDAVIWIGPLFAYQLVERWLATRGKPRAERIPWQVWLVFVVTLIPWFVFSLSYFGSPFPHSLTAKSVAYVVPPASALVQFIRIYSTPFFEFETFGSNGAMVGSVLYLILSLIGISYAARRLPRLLPLLIYPWLYMAIFSIANPLLFRWYMVPPLPALMLGIVVGAWALVAGFQRQQRTTRWITPAAVGALAILWGGMSLHAWTLTPDHGPNRPAPTMAWHKIELLYQQVGTELRDQDGVTPETRVASADIGAIGYFSRATIIDTVGLVTPELSTYYPVPPSLIVQGQNYAIPPKLITDTQPDYFVTMEAFVRLGLEKDAAFKAEYGDPFKKIPTDFYGTDMRVYKRQ
ncbi:MAG: hypothetical protein ABI947_00930 [Chloroflexota bacterium]